MRLGLTQKTKDLALFRQFENTIFSEILIDERPFDKLLIGAVDLICVPIKEIAFFEKDDKHIIASLLSREFQTDLNSWTENIPSTSKGVYALVCKIEDLKTRKVVLKLHDEQTMFCSNVEREIYKVSGLHKIHCFQDRVGRYHLGILDDRNDEKNTLYYVQSTFIGLVSKAIKDLNLQ